MIKKTITYTDYDGNVRKEDFYFNLSKAELMEMAMSTNGGLDKFLTRIAAEQDGPQLMKMFKELILMSYGKKSDDGKRFMKSKELRDEFEQTDAYSELFMELCGDTDKVTAFVNGIIPSAIAEEIKKNEAAKKLTIAE